MSCKLTFINGKSNSYIHKEYLCDSEDDIVLLPKYGIKGNINDSNDTNCNEPCAIGSIALVVATSDLYILAPNNEWTKL